MDQQQYELACEIIKVDCYGKGVIRDSDGTTCALGGLAAAVDPDWAATGVENNGSAYSLPEDAFGLTAYQCDDIIRANDKSSVLDSVFDKVADLEDRRRRVLLVLRKIYAGTL